MKLHVVGSGCPAPNPDRYGSAFVLETSEFKVLIDCGPATTYKLALMGLDPLDIHHLFFTHHHFDHNSDFPCFALTRWDQSNGEHPPLEVFGPPPTTEFVNRLLGPSGAFYDDWHSRVTHPVSLELHRSRGGELPRPEPKIVSHEVSPVAPYAEVTQIGSCKVSTVQVYHVEPTLISLAYRFESVEGSILFCGDCGDSPALRTFAKGCGTLVICCTHFDENAYEGIVAGTPQVAGIAGETGATRVVLTHASPGFSLPGQKERAVAEISKTYSGQLFFPDELTSIDLA